MHILIRIIIILLASRWTLGEDIPPVQVTDIRRSVIDFERKHDPFVRSLFGCPPTGRMTEFTCDPKVGVIDAFAFKEARRAAANLYGLKER